MKTVNNPITEKGKVVCLHFYERCLKKKWYDMFIAIFTYENIVYLYKVERNENKKTLIEFGEINPYNMTKAVSQFKKLII